MMAACVLLLAACNTPSNEATPAAAAAEAPAKHDYGVKASYSTDFTIADAALGDKVVALWKHFDANTLDSVASYFADSVYQEMPGYKGKMSRDSALAAAKAFRASLSSCVSTIDALVPLKASDKEESVVCIWGVETTEAGGKKMVRDISEAWGFNKDGKVAWIKQYELKK
jgi:hypothetical protein